MLGCSLPDVPLQNSSFNDTWLCQKKMYKNTMGEMGLQTIALCTLSSSISAPRKKFSKKMPRMLRCCVPDVPLQNSSFHDTLLYQKKV